MDIATGASTDIEGATFYNSAVLAVQGTVTSTSGFTLGTTGSSAALQIEAGGVVDLQGNQGIGGAGGSSITNAGTLELTGGSGNPAVIGVQYTQSAGGEALAEYSGTTLESDGAGDKFTGAIDGLGTVEFSGGNTYTFAKGTRVGAADLDVTNSATLAINANLTDGGALNLSNGGIIKLGQNVKLNVTGQPRWVAKSPARASAIVLLNDPTALIDTDGLTIGGTATLQNKGQAGQQAGNVMIGDTPASTAALQNDSGATYSLTGNGSISSQSAGSPLPISEFSRRRAATAPVRSSVRRSRTRAHCRPTMAR